MNYLVKCPTCSGTGKVTSAEWRDLTVPPTRAQMAEMGPEEIDCNECDGLCQVLTAAGQEIAEVFRYITQRDRK